MKTISRRSFIKKSGAGFALTSFAGQFAIAGMPERRGKIIDSGRKLNIASVGIGGQGNTDLQGVSGENIVAMCDVSRAADQIESFEKHPDAKRYSDYRKMLLEMDDQIDAVVVTTPDHMHFPIASMAMRMGKHVYVQKPMAHTVWGARQLRNIAEKHNVVTQMGNQGHANEGTRLVREWVQSGAIGDVREVHIWTNRPLTSGPWAWKQGVDRPDEEPPVPDTLDWNLWLGVAPRRPYHPFYAPKKWRGWWDFGCGALGDMGCHLMDASFWALDLKYPESVSAESSPVNEETAPKWSIITYNFPARGSMPPVKVVWYDGGKKPPRPKELGEGRKLSAGGQLIVGDKATIMDTSDYCRSPRIIPEEKMRGFAQNMPPKTIPRVPKANQYLEWINACKGGPMPGSNFNYSGPLTEMVLMGNLALRASGKIEWDGENMRCTNLPAANRYVKKEYRAF